MARESLDVLHQDGPAGSLRRSTTHPFSNSDGLAGNFTHEGAEDQLVARVRGVQDIEPRPVHRGRRRRQRVVQVP
jgi:hypothetical protein